MKQSLQSILETKSQYDFITGIMDNEQEDIKSKTTYKTQFKFNKSKLRLSITPKSQPSKVKKRPIYLRFSNHSSQQQETNNFIFLKTLFKDIQQPQMSKTNYSTWSTSHKQTIQSNFIPPIKKNYLLIKTPDNNQPAVGYYNPVIPKKVRGSVKLFSQNISQQSQSLNILLNQNEKQESPLQKEEFIKVPETKLQNYYDNEKKKLMSKSTFQLPLKDLNANPFTKQWSAFLAYKNKFKLLRDHKYEDSLK
ncbi:unnamed protein product (macronuclear) [Paramecium tetraurelia]|uniref:Uncharacterized protein n=1 Tax=Paramecium tetraurelia TaxID=5888 RepID=A0CGF2_PARTE|nr:uncharacterized protein GSPATT00007309001 [Paramecium tetraurelia]CAK69869.1 unnamed protein product [Paramecium tetraurelia]|eukprot:XP_001437266.1 hypothetical protein (macronuclear) [Paramecium tetraurelia strain d4-2]